MAKRYLLDTHYLLWFQENNPRISTNAMEIIQDSQNEVFFSQVSLFEIAIKQKLGKLPSVIVSVEDIYQQAVAD
jgi:PIN domain nuclease of toxin-antitoxin system